MICNASIIDRMAFATVMTIGYLNALLIKRDATERTILSANTAFDAVG